MTRFPRTLPNVFMLITAATFVSAWANADTPTTGILTMRLAVRNNNGQVGCMLWNSEKGFPADHSSALQRKWCTIADSTSVCPFDPIPAGTYAVVCFHDENKNGKLDRGFFGQPTEGVVASSYAKGTKKQPHFSDAKFTFSGAPTELSLSMNYF